jgi:hypothetical protein
MFKRIVISSVVFVGLVALLYACLGGFKDAQLSYSEFSTQELIMGKSFEGKYNDSELEKVFFEVKEHYQSLSEKGELVVVNYPHSREEDGFIKQFIGIRFLTEQPLPEGWETLEIATSGCIQATVLSHNLVMPRPHKIRAKAQDFALDKGMVLEDISIEKYLSDWELIVMFPIKNSLN